MATMEQRAAIGSDTRPRYADAAHHWLLDQSVTFLNHGSFGSCPREVLDVQAGLREQMERRPVQFLDGELESRLDAVRDELGAFLGAAPERIALVPNATAGVNTVVRSLSFEPGDEIVATDHEYNASANVLRHAAATFGAHVVIARIPFPIRDATAATDAVLAAVTARTRLVLLSHVTSPTALILPVERLVGELDSRGVDTLVDGAHAPGMLPLDLDGLGAAYYTGNAHKWLCAPKGSGFLYVRADRVDRVRPLSISHGANSPRRDRQRFRLEFDWTGTVDPTAYLSIPAALRFMGGLLPGGWPELMDANHRLALQARDELVRALGIDAPAPDDMLGSMAAVPLPLALDDDGAEPGDVGADSTLPDDPLHATLVDRFGIDVPVTGWPLTRGLPPPRHRVLRVSAQRYNDPSQYAALAAALRTLIDEQR